MVQLPSPSVNPVVQFKKDLKIADEFKNRMFGISMIL
jgi:hypothetical protein